MSAFKAGKTIEPERSARANARGLLTDSGFPLSRDLRYRAAWLACALVVGLFYLWAVQSGWQQFVWNANLDGYYDLLGRAFANGHVRLPVEPQPELLKLPDPWDARANHEYRLLDAVLYKQHYYLYHGPTPAILLFTPWRLLTHHDLPESFAVLLLCFAGYLVDCELLVRLLSLLPDRTPVWLFTGLILTLGLGQSLPFLLQRAIVYEVAIAGGFFCVNCGFLCALLSLTTRRRIFWAALAGLSFGLAIGCRPHLGLAGLMAFLLLFIRPARPLAMLRALVGRSALAYLLPFAGCCLGIAAYNFVRFHNPFEFGVKYQLGDPQYQNLHLSAVNIFPGLYYLLFCLPLVEPVFPFFRLAVRIPRFLGYRLPARYFLEPIAGAVSLSPLTGLGLAMPVFFRRFRDTSPLNVCLWAMYGYCAGCILFIAAVGLTSHRFEADFQPVLLVIGSVCTALLFARWLGRKRALVSIAIAAVIGYSVVANVAIALQGPYDQFVQAKPLTYFALSQWFSPIERFRPLLNPPVHLSAYFDFPDECWGGPVPLISLGEAGSNYLLIARCLSGDLLQLSTEAPPGAPARSWVLVQLLNPGLNLVQLDYTPEDHLMTVRWNRKVVIQDRMAFLLTARSQVNFGYDPTLGSTIHFGRRIVVFRARNADRSK